MHTNNQPYLVIFYVKFEVGVSIYGSIECDLRVSDQNLQIAPRQVQATYPCLWKRDKASHPKKEFTLRDARRFSGLTSCDKATVNQVGVWIQALTILSHVLIVPSRSITLLTGLWQCTSKILPKVSCEAEGFFTSWFSSIETNSCAGDGQKLCRTSKQNRSY